MIKCNAPCKNNINGLCDLDHIEIDFIIDDYQYAQCSNFKESEEYQKKFYKLEKINDNTYLVIRKSVFEDVDIELIIKNINPKENINIIVDNLIFYGSPKASNRFYIYKYDNQTKKPIFEKVCSKNNNNYDFKRITELTCDYLRRLDNFGCCNNVVKRMIKNGINL